MLKVKKVEYPLQRLISIRNKFSYHLLVRGSDGKQKQLLCEFQTHAEFVFNGKHDLYQLGDTIDVKVQLLTGNHWHRCRLMHIEEHSSFSLYQFAIMKVL